MVRGGVKKRAEDECPSVSVDAGGPAELQAEAGVCGRFSNLSLKVLLVKQERADLGIQVWCSVGFCLVVNELTQ